MRVSTKLSPIRCPGEPSAFFSFSPFKPQGFVSFHKSSLDIPVSIEQHRYLYLSLNARSEDRPQRSSIQEGEPFFRSILERMESVYLSRNPTAKAILDLVEFADKSQICYDHLAFRTLGVNGYGIDSMASFFLDYSYTSQDELRFPAKKLKAQWFSPPRNSFPGSGSGMYGPLPRVFISELLIDQMSPQAKVFS